MQASAIWTVGSDSMATAEEDIVAVWLVPLPAVAFSWRVVVVVKVWSGWDCVFEGGERLLERVDRGRDGRSESDRCRAGCQRRGCGSRTCLSWTRIFSKISVLACGLQQWTALKECRRWHGASRRHAAVRAKGRSGRIQLGRMGGVRCSLIIAAGAASG